MSALADRGDASQQVDGNRRWYSVHADMRRNPSDYTFLNKAEVFAEGGNGRLWTPIGDTKFKIFHGLPALHATPRVMIAERRKPIDFYGFTANFVSDCARQVLETCDPKAFEFAECQTIDNRRLPVSPYWMMRGLRVVDGFDEARSEVTYYRDLDPEGQGENPNILSIKRLVMPALLGHDVQAFLLSRKGNLLIFSSNLVDAYLNNNLSGLTFTPLQEPTKAERKKIANFEISEYWYEPS